MNKGRITRHDVEIAVNRLNDMLPRHFVSFSPKSTPAGLRFYSLDYRPRNSTSNRENLFIGTSKRECYNALRGMIKVVSLSRADEIDT